MLSTMTITWPSIKMLIFIHMMLLMTLTNAQPTTLATCQKLDLAIAIPCSTNANDWNTVRNFVGDALNQLDVGNGAGMIRVAVVTYRGTTALNFDFNQYSTKADIVNAVRNLPRITGSGTDVSGAMKLIRDNLFQSCPLRADSQCTALIMYDSIPDDLTRVNNISESFTPLGIQILTMGLSSFVGVDYGGNLPTANSAFNRIYASIGSLPMASADAAAFICTYRPPVCAVKADIVFILDQSTSIVAASGGYANWNSMLSFVEQVIHAFTIDSTQTRVGMVRFSNSGSLTFGFNQYTTKLSLISAVSSQAFGNGGETNLADGFRVANNQLFTQRRAGVETICILITDGVPNIEAQNTLIEVNRTKALGVEVFAVGITNQIDQNLLQRVASSPYETHFFYASDYSTISQALTNLTLQSCTVAQGSTTTSTTTTPPTTTTTTPTPEPSTKPSTDACQMLDLAIAIPCSTNANDWNSVRNFVGDALNQLDIGNAASTIRVAVVTYRGTTALNFDFNQYSSKADIINAVKNLPRITGSGNNVAAAMVLIRDNLFSACPLRLNSQCTALIMYDSNPNDPSMVMNISESFTPLGIQILTMGLTPEVTVDYGGYLPNANSASNRIYESIGSLQGQTVDAAAFICTFRPPVCAVKADIGFILDQSTSIVAATGGFANWNSMLSFVTQVIDAFTIGPTQTRVGMVRFSTSGSFTFGFNQYTTKLSLNSIVSSQAFGNGGETNLADGFRVANNQLFSQRRLEIKTICILITDGVPNIEAENTFIEVNRTKALGIDVFAIGITDQIDQNLLQKVASSPYQTHFFYVSDYSKINEALKSLTSQSCTVAQGSTTTRTSTSTTTTTTRPTTTSTTTTIPTTTTMTTTTTTQTAPSSMPIGPPVGCSQWIDIVFVVATSTLDPASQLQLVQRFIGSVISSLPVGVQIQVGAMSFATNPMLGFKLGQYTTSSQLLSALQTIPYSSGSTNMAAALNYLRNTMFSAANGARSGVAKVAVIISNANSADRLATYNEADLTRRAGIDIITVAVGSWLDPTELFGIASYPSNRNALNVGGYSSLSSIQQQVQELVCGCTTTQCETDPCFNGQCKNQPGSFICVCDAGWVGVYCDQKCQARTGDLIFVVDSSRHIGVSNFQRVTTFIGQIVQNLDVDSSLTGTSMNGFRIGLLTYSDNVNVFFQLNSNYSNKAALISAMNVPYIAGSTNTADAISVAANQMFAQGNGARPGVPKYMLVITDGFSNQPTETWIQAVQARAKGINIIAIGVGAYNYTELQGIASAPEASNVYTLSDFTALSRNVAIQISKQFCQDSNACVSNPCQNGAICTPIVGGYTCSRCPAGFTGFNCERGCSGVMDLVFVIDSSGSIQWERMNFVREFIVSVVNNLDIGQSATRVGAVYFSTSAFVAFTLDAYTNRQDVAQAIRAIPYIGSTTNIADAQRRARIGVLGLSGNRADVINVIVLFTDGTPNVEVAQTLPENILLKNTDGANTVVITVSVGAQGFVNFDLLNMLASAPRWRNILSTFRFGWLQSNLTNPLLAATCNDLNECISNPCLNGGTCNNGYGVYTCTCVPPYSGYNCERTWISITNSPNCNPYLDIVFILDLSGSISDADQYDTILNFTRAVTVGLPSQARVGVVTFDSVARNEFYLSTYASSNRVQLLNAIEFLTPGGTTNAQAALNLVRTSQFNAANGDQSGSPNVIIYVSDGYSDVTEGSSPSANAAQQLKNNGVRIITVGLTDNPNMSELNNISSKQPVDNTFNINSAVTYTNAASNVLNTLCI